jgi:NADPH:quinone reductase-like Zn-dependent oxidoreductase
VKAAYIESHGSADDIRYGELPDPEPASGEVLVRVEAVAVNSVDTFVRSGAWRTPVTFPLVVGRDLVGTVVRVGPDAPALATGDPALATGDPALATGDPALATGYPVRPGDLVWTNSAGYGGRPGATAELTRVQRDRLYPLPSGADPVRFVAAVHPGATAFGALAGRARLRAGETVAVVGANGSVGMCLIQVAAAYGAEVIASVRDAGSAPRLRELGARTVVTSGDAEHVIGALRERASDGVDVLVDTTGRMGLADVPGLLRPRGRVVLLAGRDRRIDLDQWAFYTRELSLIGFIVSGLTAAELRDAAAWINGTYPASPLTVSVGQVLTFADAGHAHHVLERGELPRMPDRTVGRLVLRQ